MKRKKNSFLKKRERVRRIKEIFKREFQNDYQDSLSSIKEKDEKTNTEQLKEHY